MVLSISRIRSSIALMLRQDTSAGSALASIALRWMPLENKSAPPQAYFRADGNFEFALPPGAKLQQVAAAGPAGMPVVQAAIEKKDNHFAIAYAFRPGSSTVRYSYELPYPNNSTMVNVPVPVATARLLVVAPPTMQISGGELQLGGQEQGMNIYGRENVAAGTVLAVNVSGTAPPPQDAGNGGRSWTGSYIIANTRCGC